MPENRWWIISSEIIDTVCITDLSVNFFRVMCVMTNIFNITPETESRVLKKNIIILKSGEFLDHSNGNGYLLGTRIHESRITALKRTKKGIIRKVKCPRICKGWQQLQIHSSNKMWGNRWDGGQYKKVYLEIKFIKLW